MSKEFYDFNYECIRNAEAAPGEEADRELWSYEIHSLSGDGTNTAARLNKGHTLEIRSLIRRRSEAAAATLDTWADLMKIPSSCKRS